MTLAAILAAHTSKSATPTAGGVAGCGAQTVGAQRATPATLATPQKTTGEQKPKAGVAAVPLASPADGLALLRAHLLVLAAAGYIDADHVHRLHDLDVGACTGLDERQLAAYLSMLVDGAARHTGRVPAADTTAIYCHHCGPVWVHPSFAAALPLVNNWPRALGCPWCFVRKAGGYIPRPPVTCSACRHFTPDGINPGAGLGSCGIGKGMHPPAARHACAAWTDRQGG